MTTTAREPLKVYCPKCGKLLAEGLSGTLVIRCRGCKEEVVIDRRYKLR